MYLVGIDIGGTKCAVVLGKTGDDRDFLEKEPVVIDKVKFPTEGTPYDVIERFCFETEAMLERNNLENNDIACIGINCGGPVDSRNGMILSPPNLLGWDEIPIVDIFEKRFGIRSKLQNDANAGALAEWLYGAGKGYRNVMFITFGTGFGAGLILDGRLYSGTNDMAGEVGHVRLADNGPVGFGKAGSCEGFCSGGGIVQIARTKVLEKLQMGGKVSFCKSIDDLDGLTAKIVGDAAEAGDELGLEIYKISGEYLGKALSIFIDILNPEIIAIGSIFARSTDILWPHAKEVIERETLVHSRKVCKVVPAALGEKIGDLEALSIAAYEMAKEL
ncbi:MAG TPA: ROK family protein [Clostridia bacterium]|nr:ROK family protein [Clostridia bacterium]HRX41633.1 ROK family protein [Clostridia bacterium]